MKVVSDDDTQLTRLAMGEMKELKEGEYLRLRIGAETENEENEPGCITFRQRSSSDSLHHRGKVSPSPSHHNRLAEKFFRLFRSRSDQHKSVHCTNSKSKKPTTEPRRRFVRVVKDAEAPPPECVSDNPHIICRYSQGYLKEHYAEIARSRTTDSVAKPLPYVTSGHTILKTSSTDPTSDRSADAHCGLKHTTFSDVVKVVEQDGVTVREERLHSDADESSECDDTIRKEFFLDTSADDIAPELAASEIESTKEANIHLPLAAAKTIDMGAVSAVFSTIGLSPDEMSPDVMLTPGRLPTMKHVKLTDLMAQTSLDS